MASPLPRRPGAGRPSSLTTDPDVNISALRRLSAEIQNFRREDVQARLGRSSPFDLQKFHPPPADSPTSELHATIISLQTALSKVQSECDMALEERDACAKRASRSEGECKALRADSQVTSARTTAETNALKSEVSRLEQERKLLAQDSAEKTALLRRSAGTIRSPSPSASSPSTSSFTPDTELRNARATAARLRRQMDSARTETAALVDAHAAELAGRSATIASLQNELAAARAAHATAQSSATGAAREAVARENAVRTELMSVRAELAARVEEAASARKGRVAAEERLFAVEEEVRAARADAEELALLRAREAKRSAEAACHEDGSVTVATLRREAAQMALWIKAIAPGGGSLEEGLAVLRAAAAAGTGEGEGKDTGTEDVKGAKNVGDGEVLVEQGRKQQDSTALQQQHRIALAQLNRRITELSVCVANAEQERGKAVAEQEEVSRKLHRSERLREVLERKGRHLREALDEIEGSIEKGDGDDDGLSSTARTQGQLKVARDEAEKLRVTLREFESSLRERDAEVKRLCVELSASTRVASEVPSDATVGGLRAQLMEAIREAAKAAEERDVALRALRESTCSVDQNAEEGLDYDPKVLKVVRLKSGVMSVTPAPATSPKDPPVKRRRVGHQDDEAVKDRDVVGSAELEARIQELEARNMELEQVSKVGERTKEVAKRKIEEVRQACCNLFGWTIRINGATYKLASIYAEGQEDELEFGMSQGGAMSLHENGYALRIGAEVDQLVHKWQSIPALLASLTLSNFEKTTVATEAD